MKNKSTMNCEQCGKLVSLQTSGEVLKENSDLDGQLCIVAMWCVQCAAIRKENKKSEVKYAEDECKTILP